MLLLPLYQTDWSNGHGLDSFPGDTQFESRLSSLKNCAVFLGHYRQIRLVYLDQCTTASFQIVSISSFLYHLTILRRWFHESIISKLLPD
jgi:hypothetical protein